MNSFRVLGYAASLVAVSGVAQPSEINFEFVQPPPGLTVDASVNMAARVSSTYELQFVRAALTSLQTNLVFQNGLWTNTFNVSTLSNGTHTLSITAQDIFGFSVQTQRTIVISHDGPPVLTILAPANQSVWPSGAVFVHAVATDDYSTNCIINVYDGTSASQKLLLRGTNVVSGIVTQRSGLLAFRAFDATGHMAGDYVRQFLIEPNSNLVEVATAPGKILDFSSNRFLVAIHPEIGRYTGFGWALNEPDAALVDRPSGSVSVLPDMAGPLRNPQRGFLSTNGAFVSYTDYSNVFFYATVGTWNAGVWNNYETSFSLPDDMQFAGRLVAFRPVFSPPRLVLRDVDIPANQFSITNGAGFSSFALAANGDLIYATGSVVLISRPNDPASPFGARTMATLTTNGFVPKTDGTNVVYSTPAGIQLWTSGGEVSVSTNGGSYLINNGWVAFTRPGNVGQAQIWVRSPAGAIEQRTFFGSSSALESLGPNGGLTFTNNSLTPPGRYVSHAGSPPWNISAAQGTPKWLPSGEPFIMLGRSLFKIGSGQFGVLNRSNNTMVVKFCGPPGQHIEVQSSSNLVSWSSVTTFSNISGTVLFTNNSAAAHEFLRARVLP